MKAILISIKPKWVAKILNGEKTLELRKSFPKDYRGWVYIYCTKDKKETKPLLIKHRSAISNNPLNKYGVRLCNGKVVARFWCDKVDRIWKTTTSVWLCENEISDKLYKESCMSDIELDRYFKPKQLGFNFTYGYAIHISDLEIFDEPKELSEFMVVSKKTLPPKNKYILTKAPQNYCYVEVE